MARYLHIRHDHHVQVILPVRQGKNCSDIHSVVAAINEDAVSLRALEQTAEVLKTHNMNIAASSHHGQSVISALSSSLPFQLNYALVIEFFKYFGVQRIETAFTRVERVPFAGQRAPDSAILWGGHRRFYGAVGCR